MKCKHCGYNNAESNSICDECRHSLTSSGTPQNWKSEIEQVVATYEQEPAKGLVHGLQKDAIQNGWGHRVNDKGRGWKFTFTLKKFEDVTYLLLTDEGTTGLTGPNLTTEEIQQAVTLPDDHKLARFTGMKWSGGSQGVGLYGRGKLLFPAVSKDCKIYFDSLTEKDGYRLNYKMLIGSSYEGSPKALEGEEAKDLIKKLKMELLSNIGTRIIIVNPIQELVEAIKNGELIKNIQETWWPIIARGAEIFLDINGVKRIVGFPEEYYDLPEKPANGWKVWFRKNIKIGDDYTIRHIHLLIAPKKIDEDFRGIHLYRQGMKTGGFNFEIPPKIKDRYFGYIELDRGSEHMVIPLEDITHYGFKKKRTTEFQKIKRFIESDHKAFMDREGLLVKKYSSEEKLKKTFENSSKIINELISSFGIDSVGEGGMTASFIVRWMGIDFPDEGNSKVVTGETISNIRFKIINNQGSCERFNYQLKIVHNDKDVVLIDEQSVPVNSSSEKIFGPYNVNINEQAMPRYEKLFIQLEVKKVGLKKQIIKKIPFFYDCDPQDRPEFGFSVQIAEVKFPGGNSHRVNTGEKITGLKYLIKNNTALREKIGIYIRTHNMTEGGNPVIEEILLNREGITIEPFSEELVECRDIDFSEEIYLSQIAKGLIELRASVSSMGEGKYAHADSICKPSKIKIYFNENEPGVSVFNDSEWKKDKGGPRSDCSGQGKNWTFIINIEHSCYINAEEEGEEARDEYYVDEMLKQTVKILLLSNNYKIFTKDKKWFDNEEVSPPEVFVVMNEAYDKLLDKIHRR